MAEDTGPIDWVFGSDTKRREELFSKDRAQSNSAVLVSLNPARVLRVEDVTHNFTELTEFTPAFESVKEIYGGVLLRSVQNKHPDKAERQVFFLKTNGETVYCKVLFCSDQRVLPPRPERDGKVAAFYWVLTGIEDEDKDLPATALTAFVERAKKFAGWVEVQRVQ